MAGSQQTVRNTYRAFARLIENMPGAKLAHEKSLTELRSGFRRPLGASESLEDRLKKAEDRIAFLRITTPKSRTDNRAGVYVQGKDGKMVEAGAGTSRDGNGRVLSNFDGKNIDPCQVKRHNVSLKRAGFVNNTHAKGVF